MTTPKPGIYYDVPFKEYVKWNCFSKSMIPSVMKNAKQLKHYLTSFEPTEPMIMGSLVDELLLQPSGLVDFGLLSDTYPDAKTGNQKPWNGNSTWCKEEGQRIIDDGLTPIKHKTLDEAHVIAGAARLNEEAAKRIDNGKKQVSIVWIDEETGVSCRARLDLLTEGILIGPEHNNSIDDLKTTRDASESEFSRQILNLGYHQQAALYLDGWSNLKQCPELEWNFIAVENTAPYGCAVHTLQPESIELGRRDYKKALRIYKAYMENDPDLLKGYPDQKQPIDVPVWALNRLQYDDSLLVDTE